MVDPWSLKSLTLKTFLIGHDFFRFSGGYDRGEPALRQRVPREHDQQLQRVPVSARGRDRGDRHLRTGQSRHGRQHRSHDPHPRQETTPQVTAHNFFHAVS